MRILIDAFQANKLRRRREKNPLMLLRIIPTSLHILEQNEQKRNRKSIGKIPNVIGIAAIIVTIAVPAHGQNSAVLRCDSNQITTYKPHKSDYAEESVRKPISVTYRLEFPNSIATLEADRVSWSDNICKTGYCSIDAKSVNRTLKETDNVKFGTIKNVKMHTDLSWSINRETGLYSFSRVNVFELPGRGGETIIQKDEGRGSYYEFAAPAGLKVK